MQKLITKGFGVISALSGIVTQGYGGFFQQVVQVVTDFGRNVVIGGKSAASRIKKNVDEIVVRVTLLSVDDQYLDITGAERSTPDQDMSRPRISTSYFGKRFVERIRLNVKRLK